MNSFGPIIAKYRKAMHLTQPELSALLHRDGIEITDKSLSGFEKGRNEPSAKQFFALCKVLGIKDVYEEVFGVNPYNPMSTLNELGRDRANEYIEMLASNPKFIKNESTVTENPVRKIKLYTLGVSAGAGNFLDDYDYEEIETDEFVPFGADFALHITGDSMMPLLRDKQIIFVHSQDTLEDGEIGVFSLDGSAYCKKLMNNKRGTALISLNKKYQPIPITEESRLAVFGKVLV